MVCLNKQCNCPDPDNYYFSAADSTCLPRKAISQACTSNIECLSRELLTCQNSVCQCPNTTTYYYSEFNNTCQEKNTYQESCNVTNDGCRSDLGLDCNSETNVCDCYETNNFYWSTASQNCLPKKTFGATCAGNLECIGVSGLECNTTSMMCACQNTTLFFNNVTLVCETKRSLTNACLDDIYCLESSFLFCMTLSTGNKACSCQNEFHWSASVSSCIACPTNTTTTPDSPYDCL